MGRSNTAGGGGNGNGRSGSVPSSAVLPLQSEIEAALRDLQIYASSVPPKQLRAALLRALNEASSLLQAFLTEVPCVPGAGQFHAVIVKRPVLVLAGAAPLPIAAVVSVLHMPEASTVTAQNLEENVNAIVSTASVAGLATSVYARTLLYAHGYDIEWRVGARRDTQSATAPGNDTDPF